MSREYIGKNSQKSSATPANDNEPDEPGFIKIPAEPKLLPVRNAARIEPRPVHWLWYPYIPAGMVTLIEGDPGIGKSWMTVDLAARLSRGEALPDARIKLPPIRVLLLNAEDSVEHTIVPRLISLGADRTMIDVVDFDPKVDLGPEGMRRLEYTVNHYRPGLVIIDPLVGYLGNVDMHRANDVRGFMAGLYTLANKTGTAIVGVRHLRKAGEGGKAIYAGIGSIDFSGAARSVMQVSQDKAGTNVVRHIKSNVAKKGPALAYAFSEYETKDPNGKAFVASRFEWLGVYEGPEDEELEQIVNVTKLDRARVYIQEALAEGPKLAQEVIKAAEDQHRIGLRTLKEAKKGLARSVKTGEHWYWELCRGGYCTDQGSNLSELAA